MLFPKIRALLTIIALWACAAASFAAEPVWPVKTVRIIVPFAPGGVTDILARMVGHRLAQKWGQSVIVENITGAGGNIGMAAALRAKPDGYTIVIAPGGNLAVNPNYLKDMPFNIETDFIPVTVLADSQNVLAVPPSLNVKSVKELLELARKRPQGITYASPGEGSTQHLAGAMLEQSAKVQAVHVAYKGFAPALNDVLSGTVDAMFLGVFDARPHINAGKLVPLAIAGPERSAFLPNVPSMRELGYSEFSANSWYSFVVRAETPTEIVQKLNADVNEALKQDHDRLQALALIPSGKGLGDFSKMLRKETQRWKSVMQQSNIKQQ